MRGERGAAVKRKEDGRKEKGEGAWSELKRKEKGNTEGPRNELRKGVERVKNIAKQREKKKEKEENQMKVRLMKEVGKEKYSRQKE